jgi:hypothetical protein
MVDTWTVMGMRGTGSHDFIVEDILVPESHSMSLTEASTASGLLYRPRLFFAVLVYAICGDCIRPCPRSR